MEHVAPARAIFDFGFLFSPIVAGAAVSLSSVSIIANALRLRTGHLSLRENVAEHPLLE